jgi:NitT/TauT family transport system permease protein
MSNEQKKYLTTLKWNKIIITLTQIVIVILFLLTWQILANLKIINPFIFSSPIKIVKTIISLYNNYNLITHILTTLYETIISFILGITLGFIIAVILYECKTLAKIIDPFLTMINSLPKVALGPIIIIWVGANIKSIIVMSLLINLIISIITIYNGFINTDIYKIKLLKSFKASKTQILTNVVIPSSITTIISSLKINISMSLIGVIMGEFLVSKQGIGYLIIYGTQVFNLNIVMSGIFILIIISFILYKIIDYIEKKSRIS